MSGYKKCQQCDANYIKNDEDICVTCRPVIRGPLQGPGPWQGAKNKATKIEGLTRGIDYGTNSRTVYLDCCEAFGWNSALADNFGRQGALLYAPNVDGKGLAAWFLGYSNLNGGKAVRWENEFITNEIPHDTIHETHTKKSSAYDTIHQTHNKPGIHLLNDSNDKNLRIVFAKYQNSGYVFFGIYKISHVEGRVVVYKLVEEGYKP